MSVAEDGNEQEQPGKTPRRADRSARHRVPPTASATAKVPLLPEPFNPAKPTFPAGAAIPRQRRGGPTAIATASIPAVPIEDDRPDFDVLFADALGDDPAEPASASPAEDDPAADHDPSARDGSAADHDPPADDGSSAEHGSSADYDSSANHGSSADHGSFADDESSADDDSSPDEVEDPATVGTLAGEVRASAVPFLDEPVALSKPMVESPALVDPAAFDPPVAESAEVEEPIDEVAAAPPPVGVAPVVVTADDSPTVADYVAPAFAIVTDDPGDEDGPDYRGSRRRIAAWRRYPIGAVAVAVLILLVTAAVVLQLVRSDGDNPVPTAGVASPRFPGVGGLPELTKGAATPSPSGGPTSASPSPRASKSSAPAAPPPSASASPSKSTSSVAPPPTRVGQLRGAGSAKCLEYRAGESNRAVIDNCDDPRSGRTNQRWTLQADGTVRADGGCLDVQNASTANLTPVRLFTCNGTPAQRWTLRGDSTLQNVNSKRCLDVANGGTSAGNPVIIYDCSTAANQKWSIQPY